MGGAAGDRCAVKTGTNQGVIEAGYRRGLDLIESGEYYEAHEVIEDVWRAAKQEERDFFQGLVHVAVAWYQAGRGNRRGCDE